MLDRLPADVLAEVIARAGALDAACCRMSCRSLRSSIPRRPVPAGQACARAERLVWCLDEAGLACGVALLRSALCCPSTRLDCLMLCCAVASRDGEKDGLLFSALHDAFCAVAYRWGDAGLMADLLRDCWEAGGVTHEDIFKGARSGAPRRLCEAVTSSAAACGDKARLLGWLCRQRMTDPRTAIEACASSGCLPGLREVAGYVREGGGRVDEWDEYVSALSGLAGPCGRAGSDG